MSKKRKDPDEFEDFDLDFDDDFDNPSDIDKVGYKKSSKKGKREPFDDFNAGLGDALKSKGTYGTAVSAELKNKFTKSSSVTSDAIEIMGDMSRLRRDIQKDLAPSINNLRDVTRRLLPRIKPLTGEKFYEKLDAKLARNKEEIKSEQEQLDEARSEDIKNMLAEFSSVNSAKEAEARSRATVEKFIDRKQDQDRHANIIDYLDQLRGLSFKRTEFTQTMLKGYMMKSLEYKAKHLFVAKDILAIGKKTVELLDDKLETIKHNTALPDIQKKKLSESYKEEQRELIIGKGFETIGDWTKDFRTNLKKAVKDKASEVTDTAKTVIDMMADMGDTMADLDEMAADMGMKPESITYKIGKFLGANLVTRFGRKLLTKAVGKAGQYGADVEGIAGRAGDSAKYYLNDLFRNQGWDDLGLGLDVERGKISRTLKDNATEEIPFDVLTRRSIVEVIPGYLAKILKQTTDIATGTNTTEELMFDLDKEDFVGLSQFKKNMKDKMFGSKKERSEEMVSGLGKMLGAYSAHGGDTDEFYTAIKDVSKFLSNSAKHIQQIKPGEIKKFVDGELSDNDYIDLVFKDVEDKDRLAKILSQVFYSQSGEKDESAHTRIELARSDLSKTRDERLLPNLKMVGALGQLRHLDEYMDEEGKLDHNKLRASYNDINYTDELHKQAKFEKDIFVKHQKGRALHDDVFNEDFIKAYDANIYNSGYVTHDDFHRHMFRSTPAYFGKIDPRSKLDKTKDIFSGLMKDAKTMLSESKLNRIRKRIDNNEDIDKVLQEELKGESEFVKSKVQEIFDKGKGHYQKADTFVNDKILTDKNKERIGKVKDAIGNNEFIQNKKQSLIEFKNRIRDKYGEDVANDIDRLSDYLTGKYNDIKSATPEEAQEILALVKQLSEKELTSLVNIHGGRAYSWFTKLKGDVKDFAKNNLRNKEGIKNTARGLANKTSSLKEDLKKGLQDTAKALRDDNTYETVTDKLANISAAIEEKTGISLNKDKPVKDVPHISGPGIFVQGSASELHLPLDQARTFWDSMITSFSNAKEPIPMLGGRDKQEFEDRLLIEINEIKSILHNNLSEINSGLEQTFTGTLGEHFKRGARKTGRGIWSGIKGTASLGAKMGSKVLSGYAGLAGGALRGVGSILPLLASGVGYGLAGIGKGIGGLAQGYGKLTGGMLSAIGNGFGYFGRNKRSKSSQFSDLYRKGEIDPGNPLVSVKQLERGLVFADGSKVESLETVDQPILDPETGNTLVSKDDIEHGLVTIEDKPVSASILSGIGKLAAAPFKLLGGILKHGGKGILGAGGLLGKLAGKSLGGLMDLTFSGIKGVGSLAKGLTERVFGIGKGGGIGKKSLKKIVGDKLDAIYALLDDRLADATVAGDTDGDGFAEGSYQDQENEANKKKGKLNKFQKMRKLAMDKLGLNKGILGKAGKVGLVGGAMSALGLGSADPAEASATGAGGGGLLSAAVGGYGLNKVKNWWKNKRAQKAMAKEATKATEKTVAKAGTKTLGKTVAKGAGKMLGKKIPLIGLGLGLYYGYQRAKDGDWVGAVGEGLSGLVSVVPLLGTAASAIIDAALIGRDVHDMYSTQAEESNVLNARLNAYGVEGNKDNRKHILDLEGVLLDAIKNNDQIDFALIKDYGGKFGFDVANKEHMSYFYTWLKRRFTPCLMAMQSNAKKAFDLDLDELDEITSEQSVKLVKIFEAQTSSIVNKMSKFAPSVSAYNAFKAGRDPKITRNSTYTEADKLKENRKKLEDNSDILSNAGLRQKRLIEKRSTRSLYSMPKQTNEDIINSMAEGNLGILSAVGESGSQGSFAVGYDKHGGTSYGRYQLSSSMGTFDKFLSWCETQPGGDIVAQRLRSAGVANTGSAAGSVPSEWKKLVKEGRLKELEHEFIKLTHYDPVIAKIRNKDYLNMINGSKALQNVIWSTAVQHGSQATSIINNAYRPGLSVSEVIENIYDDRSKEGRWKNSTRSVYRSVVNRFERERANATALAEQERASKQALGGATLMAKAPQMNVDKTPTFNLPTGQSNVVSKASKPAIRLDANDVATKTVKAKMDKSQAVTVNPDTSAHSLYEAQLNEMKQFNNNFKEFNKHMRESFDKNTFSDMNKNLKTVADKDLNVKLDANILAANSKSNEPNFNIINVSKDPRGMQ